MAFFLYVAVVLVSISSILLELDWLTKPKLEQPVPVARNTTARPVPVPQAPRETVATAEATNKADTANFEPTAKKVERPRETTGSAPANETANASPPPVSPQPAPPPAATNATPPLPPAGDAASAPAPAAQQTANTNTAPPPPADPPPTPVATTVTNPAPTTTTQSALNAPKTCDVQACSASYQSFRAADCTYQPMQGERRVCTKRGNGNVARAPVRIRPDRDAELREDERAVRQLPRGDDRAELPARNMRPADDDDDDYAAPRPPGRVPMIGRYGRWP